MSSRVITNAAIFVVAAIALVTAATESDGTGHGEDAVLLRTEVAGLRAHFDSVLAELNQRDVSALTPRQRAARASLVRTLAGYRDAGRFPHNHDFAGQRVPYFRDDHGTLCAMAFLIASTGRRDIVDAVVARLNNAYIPELASDPRLGTWLDSVGLTLAEAARIQPAYEGPRAVVEERQSRAYALPSVLLGATALISAAANWAAPVERKPGGAFFLGALSGAAAGMLGVAMMGDDPDGEMRALGLFDVAMGAAALHAVVRRSVRRNANGTAKPPVVASESRFTVDVIPSRQGGQVRPATVVKLRF